MINNRTAIIVAGGKGQRMKMDTPKQFLVLSGKPILMHTMDKFYQFDKDIKLILVLPQNQIEKWKQLCEKYQCHIPHQIVSGGSERFYSVKNALQTVTDSELIAIHDGVRPMVDKETIARCFQCAEKYGTAIPAIALTDSIRMITEDKSLAVDRSAFVLVQTPQVFRTEILFDSYAQAFDSKFTDDASVAESAGYAIKVVEGNRENIKITTSFDLEWAALQLKLQEGDKQKD